ncbi:MAG: multicopper polyphenol oxidase [Desulfovibrionaceae bacterium CG1_02_65_16]|nr:MAG: multicopper polyphenol oxidase [Desulfovibrionaceae bacterium CG1_02_65_16]
MVPVDVVDFRFPGVANVRCAFTTRRGGASLPPFDGANLSFDVGDDPASVTQNRRDLVARLGLERWSELRQVHGDTLLFEPAPTPMFEPPRVEADAQAAATPGLALVVKTADCQPILLAHESGRFVAALHAGWRGNVLNLPGTAVARLCARYACAPRELFAVRGPSLGPAQAQFINFAAEFGDAFRPFYTPAAQTVDLWRLTRHQLETAGLEPERIFGLDRCTQSNPADFFSYRGSRTTGRMMALIWMA